MERALLPISADISLHISTIVHIEKLAYCIVVNSRPGYYFILLGYRGSPIYGKFTNTVPTTGVFGLCTFKWEILALVGDPYNPTNANFA